jgi:hypothetical protein
MRVPMFVFVKLEIVNGVSDVYFTVHLILSVSCVTKGVGSKKEGNDKSFLCNMWQRNSLNGMCAVATYRLSPLRAYFFYILPLQTLDIMLSDVNKNTRD